MLGLTSLDVYSSLFNVTVENNNFELYKNPDSKSGGNSYEKVKDEIEKEFKYSDITATDLQDELLGPIIIEAFRE